MRPVLYGLVLLAALAAAAGLWLTQPPGLQQNWARGHDADAQTGQLIFTAAGCASCHAAPEAEGEAKLVLAGGLPFASDFGTFYAPNISPDPQAGIGDWTLPEFARAVTRGVSRQGQHLYPAFPYGSYAGMTEADVANLYAYMQTLPPDPTPNRAHDVGFPFNIRRGLGLWKVMFLKEGPVVTDDLGDTEKHGRYLSEVLAHCGECHTPRNGLGGLDYDRWLAGAPNPNGKGTIPNITPGKLDWSEADLVGYFTNGFTPDFDSVGGEMAAVVENLSKLPETDRQAIAAYLKRVPAQQ